MLGKLTTVGAMLAITEICAACALLQYAQSPSEVLLCGLAGVIGLAALHFWLED